jgi:hypothetical protein
MRINYQVLLSGKDPAPFFNQWRGGHAALWDYTVTHLSLVICVTREDEQSHLNIYCGDVTYLQGPTKWKNSSFEIERIGREEIILRDRQAGVEVRAGMVGVEEAQTFD